MWAVLGRKIIWMTLTVLVYPLIVLGEPCKLPCTEDIWLNKVHVDVLCSLFGQAFDPLFLFELVLLEAVEPGFFDVDLVLLVGDLVLEFVEAAVVYVPGLIVCEASFFVNILCTNLGDRKILLNMFLNFL
jgi:hypothetical protein